MGRLFKKMICLFFKDHNWEKLPKEDRYIIVEQCKRCGERIHHLDHLELALEKVRKWQS